jgi:hypothetical protein
MARFEEKMKERMKNKGRSGDRRRYKWRKWLKTNGKDIDKKKGQTVDVRKGFGKIGLVKLEIMSKGITRKAPKVRKRRT